MSGSCEWLAGGWAGAWRPTQANQAPPSNKQHGQRNNLQALRKKKEEKISKRRDIVRHIRLFHCHPQDTGPRFNTVPESGLPTVSFSPWSVISLLVHHQITSTIQKLVTLVQDTKSLADTNCIPTVLVVAVSFPLELGHHPQSKFTSQPSTLLSFAIQLFHSFFHPTLLASLVRLPSRPRLTALSRALPRPLVVILCLSFLCPDCDRGITRFVVRWVPRESKATH